MSDGYRQVGSFESDPVDAVGVDDGAIAVGIGDRVVVETGSDRVEIDHGDRIVDVALADRVLVLSSDALTTYSRTGERIREQPAADSHAVAAVSDEGLAGVLGPERLRSVDIETGRERFDVERVRPGGPADDALLGTPAGFAISTWSFLTRIDLEGEVDFDRNLEAVVRSLGRCDDAIVAALQNERLVAADLESGTSRWRTELAVEHVAPVGESSVLVTTADGIRAVDPSGATTPVAGLSSGEGYATPDSSLVCAVRDETVSTYVHSRDQLRVAVATESVGVGGTIDVEVTNVTDRERRLSLSASIDEATLSPADRTAAVEAGETTIVDFPVESIRAEGKTTVELTVDGSVLEQAVIDLDDAASGGIAVDTDIEVATIEHGVAELAVTVENVGGVGLEALRLRETNEGTDALKPGEEWTGTVSRPYEPDRRVSVGLEVARGDRRREYAPTCTLPPVPTIDVEPDGDAVRATVETDDSVTVVDRLVIELPGAGRVRTEVTIERDEFLLIVPQFDDGTARIGFESLDVDERVRLSGGPGSFGRSSRIGGSDRRRTGRTDGTRSDHTTASTDSDTADLSAQNRRENRDDRDDRHDGTAPTDSAPDEATADAAPATPSPSGPDYGDDGSDDRSRAGGEPSATASASDEERIGGGSGADADEGDVGEPQLVATRRIDEDSIPAGHAVRDRIELENQGESAGDVTVEIGDSTVDVGRLAAGDRTAVERSVAIGSGSETVLSQASVVLDGTVCERLPKRELAASGDGLAVRATVDATDGTVVADIVNRSDRLRTVRGLEIGGRSVPIEARLEHGETTTATGALDEQFGTDTDALEGVLVVGDGDGAERRLDIIADVSSATKHGPNDGVDGDGPFQIGIGPETQVAGEYGTVVLVFENEGDRPLTDVAVSASGEPINDLFYSEARRERLEPGDRIEHFVDMEPGVRSPSFDATIRYAADGSEREVALRAAGPSAEDEAAWTDDHREQWSIDRVENASEDADGPSSLSTPFRLE
ncbi:hypothetical protein ACFO5R_00385 [Halosolutus amylolyticus]|uniref:PQQ-like domain-containing protein n=1 Tax=Halosolutus amylolyticus TaxID=2932267 RepID=A0ABD5PJ25_9EURY|nr:hypothetical protein [Halosolutus amylolyticus]